MNQTKVHSQGNVPFQWENKPGVCKLSSQEDCSYPLQKLPPPPPSAFQPPSRTSSRRGLRKSDDPFLAAYKECTKSTTKGNQLAKKDGGSGLKMGKFGFSCKQSCSVRKDNLVRISELALERDRSCIES